MAPPDFSNTCTVKIAPTPKNSPGLRTPSQSKVATLYLLKIRFLIKLSKTLKQRVYDTYLLNPNSYFTKVFQRGGSTQLESTAITANHYSWYRPKIPLKGKEADLIDIYENISLAELQKILSLNHIKKQEDRDYSTLPFTPQLLGFSSSR